MASIFAQKFHEVFTQLASAERAQGAAAYMKHHFEFYGVATPERRLAVREIIADNGLPTAASLSGVVKELWKMPHREMQYGAIDLMERSRKTMKESDIDLYEYCITHKSWWDSVDAIASHLVGDYFKKFPQHTDERVSEWIVSDNMWLNRTAIIFQIGYKQKTDTKLLERAIIPHLQSKEFFLQKAIGWALRSYSYVNPDYVRETVERLELKPLSVREAMKAILRDGL